MKNYLTAFLLFISSTAFCSGLDLNSKNFYINSKDGYSIKRYPEFESPDTFTIPNNEKVYIIDSLEFDTLVPGKTGRWILVFWKDKTGWIFSEFLRGSNSENDSQLKVKKCGNFSDLKKIKSGELRRNNDFIILNNNKTASVHLYDNILTGKWKTNLNSIDIQCIYDDKVQLSNHCRENGITEDKLESCRNPSLIEHEKNYGKKNIKFVIDFKVTPGDHGFINIYGHGEDKKPYPGKDSASYSLDLIWECPE